MRQCKPECRCILCDKSRPAKTCVKVCISIPADLWEAFGDEATLMGQQKSPLLARLIGAFLKKRKEQK